MGLSDFMKESVYEMFSSESYQGSVLSQKEQQEKINKQQKTGVVKQAVQGLATGVQSKMYSNQAIADSPMPDKQLQAGTTETPNKQQRAVADKKPNKQQQNTTKMIAVVKTPNGQQHVNKSTQNKTTNGQQHVVMSVQVNSTRQTRQQHVNSTKRTRRPQVNSTRQTQVGKNTVVRSTRQEHVNRSKPVNRNTQNKTTNKQQRVVVGMQSRVRNNQAVADLTTSRNERRLPSTLANIHKEKDDLQMGE